MKTLPIDTKAARHTHAATSPETPEIGKERNEVGRSEKRYPCIGYEITIKEAADAALVAPSSLKTKLSKLGGDMEAVMMDYEKKYGGGVIARMENMLEAKSPEERAAQEIMAALGIDEETGESICEDECGQPAGGSAPEEANGFGAAGCAINRKGRDCYQANEPRITFAEPGKVPDSERDALAIYNATIDGLLKLVDEEGFMRSGEHRAAVRLLDALEIERRTRFEPLVDWNALARK